MYEVVLNDEGASNNEMFFIELDRAKDIIDAMSEMSTNAVNNYREQYRIIAVVKNGVDGDGELMHRLNTSKLLREMLALAVNQNEYNFILYCALTAIDRVSKIVTGKLKI